MADDRENIEQQILDLQSQLTESQEDIGALMIKTRIRQCEDALALMKLPPRR